MELMKWKPRHDVFNLTNQFNRMFEDFLSPALQEDESLSMRTWNPKVDIYDEKDKIVIKAEIPGIDKKDVSVDVSERVLTIQGERKVDEEVKEDKFYRRERFYGKFERSFTLPADVNPEKVTAEYKEGILKVEIPKPEAHQPKHIAVH